MANKKVSQLVSKPSVLVTDLFPIADPTTGQLFKTTISDLGTAIGSGVSSVNGLVGAVVLDTDDIQELVSPTNKWFTDTRARAALSASSPLTYNSGTGAFGIQVATGSQNGYLSSADWTTFNNKLSTATAASTYVPYTGATANVNLGLNYSLTAALIIKSGGTSTQFLKADGSIDTNTYLTTGSAASTYLALAGGTLTGALNGTSATFTGDLTLSATNPRLYFTDTDNNPDYFISNTDGTFTIYDVTNSTSRFTIGTTGNGTFGGNLTVGQIIRSGGTSSQFLKADGSVDSTSYQPILTNPVTGTGTSGIVAKFSGTSTITDSIIYDNGTRVSIGANVTTSNTFTSVSSTTSAYAVVAQASSAAHGIWSNVLGTGEIFRGQTAGGSYFIINNGGNAFLNGNLNVGDFASTSYRLNVVGTANFTGALSGTSATFSGNVTIRPSTGYNAYFQTSGTSVRINYLNDALSANVGAAFRATDYSFQDSNGSAVFTIASSGAATFSSSVTAANFYVPSSNEIRFYNTNSTNWGTIKGSTDATNGYITLTGGSGNGMIIANSGNVGIGTTAPTQSLDVSKAGVNAIRVINTANASDAYYIAANTAGSAFFGINSTGPYIYTASALDFTVITNNVERMRITSDGNVLIGATAGIASTRRELVMQGVNGSVLSLGNNTNADRLQIVSDSGENALINNKANTPMILYTNNTERMRITSGGNVGIGTTSPGTTRLAVNGDMSAGRHFTNYGSVSAPTSTWVNLFQLPTNCNYSLLIHVREPETYSNYTTIAWIYNYYNGGVNLPAIASYVLNQNTSLQISGGYIQGRQASGSTATIYWDVTIFGSTSIAY